MSYNKEELLALSAEEKVALAEELLGSIENETMPMGKEDIFFAEDRLKLHLDNPEDGLSVDDKSHL